MQKEVANSLSLYNPHKTTISSYLKDIDKEIDSLSSQYENIILLGDFNCENSINILRSA